MVRLELCTSHSISSDSSSKLSNKRTRQSSGGDDEPPHSELAPVTRSDGGIYMRSGSSVSALSHYHVNSEDFNSEAGQTASRSANANTGNPSSLQLPPSSSSRGRGAGDEGDEEADDQQSTAPRPPDFDNTSFKSSPPSLCRQRAIVTRAVKRARALPVDGPNSTQSDESTEPRRASVNLVPRNTDGNTVLDIADDEYRLSPSDNNGDDSEELMIRELVGTRSKRAKRKSTGASRATASLKSKGKQVAKAKVPQAAAKSRGHMAINKTTASTRERATIQNPVNRPPKAQKVSPVKPLSSPQNIVSTVESSSQRALNVVPDSQEHTGSLITNTKSSNVRKSKKAFFDSQTDGQPGKVGPSSFSHGSLNTDQMPIGNPGEGSLLPPKQTKSQQDTVNQLVTQKKRSPPDHIQSEPKRKKVNNSNKSSAKKGTGISPNPERLFADTKNLVFSPIMVSSDWDSQSNGPENGGVQLQEAPSCHTESKSSEGPGHLEPREQPEKKTKVTPNIEDPFIKSDDHTQIDIHQSIPHPFQFDDITKHKEEQQELEVFEVYLPNRDLHSPQEAKQSVHTTETVAHQPLKRSRVSNSGSPFLAKPVTISAKVAGERAQQPERIPLTEIKQPLIYGSTNEVSMSLGRRAPQVTTRISTVLRRDSPADESSHVNIEKHEVMPADPSVTGKQQHADTSLNYVTIHTANAPNGKFDQKATLHQNSLPFAQRAAQKPRSTDVEAVEVMSANRPISRKQQYANTTLDFNATHPVKATKDFQALEPMIHPRSLAFGQRVARKPDGTDNCEQFIKGAPATAEEVDILDRTPIMTRENDSGPVMKQEAELIVARGAVSHSIQELTTNVLRHLNSKETAIHVMVETYQRNARRLIDDLLDRQSSELCQATTDFNARCIQLGSLYEKSVHYTKMIQEKVSEKDDPTLRDWKQKTTKLEEAIKTARQAMAAI
ncbi:hypothetical protein F5Y19DRAFT_472447 [Xylariaceae sp. FL1651]|nr:hypothetical protein F5Y19DRAFT_472447 [Xylariaceae sp. FL1651]